MKYFITSFLFFTGAFILASSAGNSSVNTQGEISTAKDRPPVPRISSVEMKGVQPHENDPAVIWYDDFSDYKTYLESSGEIDFQKFFGSSGGSMKAGFKEGQVSGPGNRKLAFGDFPTGSPVVNKGKKYDTIYWRIYLKHEEGWQGSPYKLSRATSLVSEKWQQAMIAHVWSGAENSLTLDPATGVEGQTANIKTTRYNDFANLSWLGNRPGSDLQVTSTEESGYWVMVESSAILNTPGQNNGLNQLWIDGRLEAERTNLNFRGSYDKHGINAVFLESYWNNGALRTQERWMDNFVVSVKPIGPIVCTPNPILYKTPYRGSGRMRAWELEIAADYNGSNVVYSASVKGNEQVKVDSRNGKFKGYLSGKSRLSPGNTYFSRVRQQDSNGVWSEWSRWHQPFNVED